MALHIACAGDQSAYTTGFYPTPVVIIHTLATFHKWLLLITKLCIVDLSTGMLTPLAHNAQNTPYVELVIPQKTGRMDPAQFCRDCRAKLVPVALEGYVLADLSDPENIRIYPITDGAEYEICGYTVTITQDKRDAGPTITITASE